MHVRFSESKDKTSGEVVTEKLRGTRFLKIYCLVSIQFKMMTNTLVTF